MILKAFLIAILLLGIQTPDESPCTEISSWKSLLNHQISKPVSDKIESLQKEGDFEIQTLKNAGGKIINLDYFPVTIKAFPNNPETGRVFTPETFLTYLRLHFNDFVNPKYAVFSPSKKTGFDEKALWESANPVGSVIHIHIPLPAGDGSVICTEFASDHWVYATLKTPWRPFSTGYDGKHPVSGFRQMGFTRNNDGTFTYYTKGVDKMTAKMQAKAAETFLKNPFKEADKLWESLRKGIYDFVVKNGGFAAPLDASPAEIHHLKWKEVKTCL
ncbi:MAG: hypothetical protein K0R65_540 [Crocinitomicaceae bacterium]|jgi:hypothetical protein|nr:hypothetical protein [Crocinitomicaceae bacterium]